MEEKSSTSHYKGIFKSTFLFGFVQVFKVIIGFVKNKVVAILLGPEGIGIMGIFISTASMLQTGAGLGISQSAVRDVSEANGTSNRVKFSKIITITKNISLFTGLFGLFLTIVLSPWLSDWTLGNDTYTISYVFLGIAVAFNIIAEGQLAILKGMRQLRSLAKATIMGAIVGLVTAVPLYYFFNKAGIIPALIITAFSAFIFSNYFVRKINYDKKKLSFKETYNAASPMIRMGTALMFVTFLSSMAAVIIASYMRSKGGLEDVGFYNAGMAIINSYFGVVITALTTDYYPRLAAVNNDNKKIEVELNRQSSVSLILTSPLIILFLVFLPWFVTILYSNEFSPTIEFMKYAIYGTLITLCSNQIDMILVAKYEIKIFTFISVLYRILQVILSIILFNYFGLIGMGISIAIMGLIHLLIMALIVYRKFGIFYDRLFLKVAFVVLIFTLISTAIGEIDNVFLRISLGIILFFMSIWYSIFVCKKYFDIKVINFIKNKFKKKQNRDK
jgi:PST family polysaccharide transporter